MTRKEFKLLIEDLNTLIKERELTLKEFASELLPMIDKRKTKVSRATMVGFYRWFSGKHKPREKVIEAMVQWKHK